VRHLTSFCCRWHQPGELKYNSLRSNQWLKHLFCTRILYFYKQIDWGDVVIRPEFYELNVNWKTSFSNKHTGYMDLIQVKWGINVRICSSWKSFHSFVQLEGCWLRRNFIVHTLTCGWFLNR
jgi:hypothetical protein